MITALPPATGLQPVFLLLAGSRFFQTGIQVLNDDLFSADAIGCKTEFGLRCKLMLVDIKAASSELLLFLELYWNQQLLADVAAATYPVLKVDPSDKATFLVGLNNPMVPYETDIWFRFPHRGNMTCTIEDMDFLNESEPFRASEETISLLIRCLEAWQQWDVIQPADAISNTEPPTDTFLVTLKDLDVLLISIKAATLKKDKRVNWPAAVISPTGKTHYYDYLAVGNAIKNSERPDKEGLLSKGPRKNNIYKLLFGFWVSCATTVASWMQKSSHGFVASIDCCRRK